LVLCDSRALYRSDFNKRVGHTREEEGRGRERGERGGRRG